MKHLLLFILIGLVICSCSDDTILAPGDAPQKWDLVKMSGGLNPTETTGEDMAWQEFYMLYPDGTFLKSRTSDGNSMQAEGTYQVEKESDRKYLVLTYKSNHQIIGSCISGNQERLFLNADNHLLSTWINCDGPGLEYKRVQ